VTKPRPKDKPEIIEDLIVEPAKILAEKDNGDLSLDEKMSVCF
jgi:hypothetical protein